MYSSQKLDGANGSSASGSMKDENCWMKSKSASLSSICAGESEGGGASENDGGDAQTSKSILVLVWSSCRVDAN